MIAGDIQVRRTPVFGGAPISLPAPPWDHDAPMLRDLLSARPIPLENSRRGRALAVTSAEVTDALRHVHAAGIESVRLTQLAEVMRHRLMRIVDTPDVSLCLRRLVRVEQVRPHHTAGRTTYWCLVG